MTNKRKVGDMVTVRTYESMKNQFRTMTLGGEEVLSNGFTRNMEYLCGNTYEIRVNNKGEYRIGDEIWSITDTMLEESK